MASSFSQDFSVYSGDFGNAGKASRTIKNALAQLGMDLLLIRKISVASYEAEVNLIIHSYGGKIRFEVTERAITLESEDSGPGIKDINLAMTEGWSTASDSIREMGFGAGMGLPNMKRSSDEFFIESKPGEGTRLRMLFYIQGGERA
jgi:anti-sigma regulatory factor (Ser/Thr protein kinase)